MRVTYVVPLFLGVFLASPSNAAVLLQVKELTDPGVVVRVSGSLDLTGLGGPSRQRLDVDTAPLITPNAGYIGAGLPGLDDFNLFADVYRDVFANPVTSFGFGGSDASPSRVAALEPSRPAPRTKLSFKEQRELDELPARIEALEEEQKEIAERLAGAELYTSEPQRVAELQARVEVRRSTTS